MESKKWYGLTISKKAAKVNTKGKSVFESDDSDDNVEDHVRVKKEPSSTSKEKKKVPQESMSEEIDPTIYEYDSIYDEMKASQKQKTSHTKSKEPRYINLLLKAADRRKKEGERRVERKIQAERVKEGDTFKDKEAFVTSAYRKKMLEMEEEEERERREVALEEMMDSTKQKDLSGFYRHFLKQTVGEEKIPEFGERDAKVDSNTQKKHDYPEAGKSKQRSESPSGARSRTKHPSPEKRVSHSDTKHKIERSHRGDSLNKSDTMECQKNVSGDLDKSGRSKPESSHRNKGRQRSCSSSDSEGRSSKSRQSKPKLSHRNQGRQRSCSSSDSEGKNRKLGQSKPKSSSHRSQGRQRSSSSSGSEGRNNKPGHSKSKTSYRSNEKQRSYSSSDSEDKKGKHNVEKNNKRKLDHVSKPVHDEKQKYAHSVKNQEEKIHERTKSDHHTTSKQTSSSEKYGSGHSSNKVIDQKSKYERDREDYKKDVRAHHRKEKESSQTSMKPTGNQGYSNKNFDNKNKEYSKHDSDYNHGEDKKNSGSKRRESSVCADYPESKRKKRDDDNDDDDDDISHTSSEDEEEMKKPSSPKIEGSKNLPKNPKIDMVTKFAKRTVGKIFDDAQARYFKRRDAAKAIN